MPPRRNKTTVTYGHNKEDDMSEDVVGELCTSKVKTPTRSKRLSKQINHDHDEVLCSAITQPKRSRVQKSIVQNDNPSAPEASQDEEIDGKVDGSRDSIKNEIKVTGTSLRKKTLKSSLITDDIEEDHINVGEIKPEKKRVRKQRAAKTDVTEKCTTNKECFKDATKRTRASRIKKSDIDVSLKHSVSDCSKTDSASLTNTNADENDVSIKTTKQILRNIKTRKNVTKTDVSKTLDKSTLSCNSSKDNMKKSKISKRVVMDYKHLDQLDNVSEVLMQMEGSSRAVVRDGGRVESGESSGSGSESEWEAVEDEHNESVRPEVPSSVEVVLKGSTLAKKVKRKFDWRAYFQQLHRRYLRKKRLQLHKIHLMCLMAHSQFVSAVCNRPLIRATSLSLLPLPLTTTSPSLTGIAGLRELLSWFRDHVTLLTQDSNKEDFTVAVLSEAIQLLSTSSIKVYVAMFVVALRALHYDARFIVSCQPITIKLDLASQEVSFIKQSDKQPKQKSPSPKKSHTRESTNNAKKSQRENSTKHYVKNKKEKQGGQSNDRRSDRRKKAQNYDESNESEDASRDEGRKKVKKVKKVTNKEADEVSSDFDGETSIYFRSPKSSTIKDTARRLQFLLIVLPLIFGWKCFWKKRTGVDVVNDKVDQPYDMEAVCMQPLHYCLAVNRDGAVKDLTCRYASKWLTQTWRLRVDRDWWRPTVGVYKTSNTEGDDDENLLLTVQQTDKPLPASIAECKSHPLYVLRRHLLKYEALYPPSVVPLGYIKTEPIYARDCVKTLHTREVWIREGRSVKPFEEMYKMVKSISRANRNRETQEVPVFGEWQTEPYKPPDAVDGIVPKNEYGNVELFKANMLPGGTVHLPYNGLQRVARKLDIDVALALVGFELRKGFNVPKFEGVIVCEEYQESLMAAYEEDQLIQRQRSRDKIEQRALGNWTKLVKGLFIRERLRTKYNLEREFRGSVLGRSSTSLFGPSVDVPECSSTPHITHGKTDIDYSLLSLLKEAQELGRISAFWVMGAKIYIQISPSSGQMHVRDSGHFAEIMKK